jgi:hypothetical protein
VTCWTVQAVAAALAVSRDRETVRRDQLASDRVKARQVQRTWSSLDVPPGSEQRKVTEASLG